MTITFQCPSCGQHLECNPDMAGEEITCPSCSKTLRIPEGQKPRRKTSRMESTVFERKEPGAGHSLTVTGFDVPFGRLVVFMTKCAVAALPALVIIGLVVAGLVRLLGR